MVIDATIHLVVECPLFEPGSHSDMRRASVLLIALAMLLFSRWAEKREAQWA